MFLRRREAAADEVAVSVAAAVPLPHHAPPAGMDHTARWCQASATQRAALTAAAREADATAAFVEQGIVGLAQRFTDLAAQASAQSARVGLLLAHSDRIEASGDAGGESVSMAELTALMQDSLRQLIDRGAGISGHAATLGQALGSVGERVRRIDGCTAELDRINQQMRMLSLNATIEAARAGEAGRGFTVVANEVRQLSQQTQRLSQQMQAETGSIAASVREGGALVDAVRDVDMSGSLATQDRLAGLLAGLLRRREEIDSVMHESARDSAALAADIAAIVTGLQFQDRSTQRLQHVVAMLDAAMQLLQQTAAETPGGDASALPDRAWLEQRLLARFTMGEVRDRARAVLGLGGPAAAAAAHAEGEMELL